MNRKEINKKFDQIEKLIDNDLDKAKKELERINPKSFPEDLQYDYYYLAGDIYYERDDFDNAIISYNLALKYPQVEYEDRIRIFGNLTTLYFDKEAYDNAIQFGEKVIKMTDDKHLIGKTLKIIGLAYQNIANFQEAVSKFSQILRIYNEKRADDWSKYMIESTYGSLAMNYWKLGDEKKSDYYIQKLLSLKDANPNEVGTAYLCKAHRHYEKREWKDALEYYTKAVEFFKLPEEKQHYQTTAYLCRAHLHYEKQEWKDALEYYTKAVEFIKDKEDKETYQSYIDDCKGHITAAAKKRRF